MALANLGVGGVCAAGGIELDELVQAGMAHAHISNVADGEAGRNVLQATGVARARVGKQGEVKRALPEGEPAGEGARQRGIRKGTL